MRYEVEYFLHGLTSIRLPSGTKHGFLDKWWNYLMQKNTFCGHTNIPGSPFILISLKLLKEGWFGNIWTPCTLSFILSIPQGSYGRIRKYLSLLINIKIRVYYASAVNIVRHITLRYRTSTVTTLPTVLLFTIERYKWRDEFSSSTQLTCRELRESVEKNNIFHIMFKIRGYQRLFYSLVKKGWGIVEAFYDNIMLLAIHNKEIVIHSPVI